MDIIVLIYCLYFYLLIIVVKHLEKCYINKFYLHAVHVPILFFVALSLHCSYTTINIRNYAKYTLIIFRDLEHLVKVWETLTINKLVKGNGIQTPTGKSDLLDTHLNILHLLHEGTLSSNTNKRLVVGKEIKESSVLPHLCLMMNVQNPLNA